MVNKSLDNAINEIYSPNKDGFLKIIDKINNNPDELMSSLKSDSSASSSIVKSMSITLEYTNQIIKIDQIKTRSDIALWIQFGLIPKIFEGLNTFNDWVTNTLLLTFTGIGKTYKYEIPYDVLNRSSVLLHSKPSQNTKDATGSSGNIHYTYEFDTKTSSNYQFVHGETIDEVVSSLMQGTSYLNGEPYFPLNAIISNEKINNISIDFITNNKLSNVFSSVNINFNINDKATNVNSVDVVDSTITHNVTISSYRINTSMFPLILDAILIALFIANTIYTIVMYKMYPKSFFVFDYIFDSLFKISFFLSLVFFNAIAIFANYSLPRVSNKNCDKAFCVSKVVLGYYDIKFDHEKLIKLTFSKLKLSIRSAVVVFGLLCFFVMLTVITSIISTWLVVNKNKHLSLTYKRYYYHLKMPLISLTIGTGISIMVIALFNSSVAHMFKSSSHSVLHNFFALFNLILGISNEATLKYIDNYSIIYSIVFIMLLLISFYLVVILVTSLLLMIDVNDKSLNFSKRGASWKYDNCRLIKFINRFSNLYNKIKTLITSVMFRYKPIHIHNLRSKIKSEPIKKMAEDDESEGSTQFDTKNRRIIFSFVQFFRFVTYFILAGCILAFLYYEYNCSKVSKVISNTIDEQICRKCQKLNFEMKYYNIKYTDLLNASDKSPITHTSDFTIETTLPNSKILTFNDLYYWLNIGSVRSLFTTIDTSGRSDLPQTESSVIALNSRYFLHPNKMPVLFSMFFYITPPKNLVSNMKKTMFHDRYYQLMVIDENVHGFENLFDNMINTIPDTVKKLMLDIIVVDSKAHNKIYNATINFYMEKSGMMTHEVKVQNVFSMFLPPKNKNIIHYIILGCTCVFLLILLGLLIKDIWNFRKGFYMYYPRSNVIHMILMYYLNDIRRVFDLIIIAFVISLLVLYVSIILYRRIILKHINDFEDIFYRYYYQLLTKKIFYIHSSIGLLLSGIIVFGVIFKNRTVRHYLYVGMSVLYQMKYFYGNITFFFLVIIFTYLFFFYFISKDYFTDFIKGNKFFKRCLRLILYDHQFIGEFNAKSVTELLLYPLCLAFKIWLTNVIFYHLWSVWPKSDYSKPGTHSTESDLFDDPDDLEEKFKHSDLEITSITQKQLDVLPINIKSKAAIESTNLFNKFKEYNKSFDASGKHKLKFIVALHDELGDEMNDLLDATNKIEFKGGIVAKQNELLHNKSHKELEEHISMLEESLSDKREELNAVLSIYKNKTIDK
ncbi:hypothetical protein MACK_002986 [Theileria orientalis]|uniref:Uncharacterized protein n=1 Tax=Theileria orientalis TaxID=68886 RepID=A0A976MDY4_THEOR|nr:hypothetical protein MACK_002986 [Theileria orientalis]